ncbi:hypothetical protein [Bradyrhizobium sp. LB11.1]|uniref:hypothetical protein n=1 Tax=Bradyrhizobium sp. LB11.1 TaxID=3156326 RepID=UPI003397A8C4
MHANTSAALGVHEDAPSLIGSNAERLSKIKLSTLRDESERAITVWLDRVHRLRECSSNAKAVAFAISQVVDKLDGTATISLDGIADRSGCSKSRVRNGITELAELGLVVIVKPGRKGRGYDCTAVYLPTGVTDEDWQVTIERRGWVPKRDRKVSPAALSQSSKVAPAALSNDDEPNKVPPAALSGENGQGPPDYEAREVGSKAPPAAQFYCNKPYTPSYGGAVTVTAPPFTEETREGLTYTPFIASPFDGDFDAAVSDETAVKIDAIMIGRIEQAIAMHPVKSNWTETFDAFTVALNAVNDPEEIFEYLAEFTMSDNHPLEERLWRLVDGYKRPAPVH